MAFTDSKVKNLKPASERRIVWEEGQTCLGLRITPTGKKSFIYMYRHETRPRMLTLGQYPALTLADARVQQAKAKALLAKGMDPGLLHLQTKTEYQGAPTLTGLAEEYIEKRSKNKKAWKEEKRILEKDVVPKWRGRKAQDIKRRDVLLLLDKIVERGAPIMANRTLGVLHRMFNFGIRRDILENNPCSVIERPGEENKRDRVLSPKEIKYFWTNIEKCKMSRGSQLALKLLLVLLQRKSEVGQAEWKEFDLNSQKKGEKLFRKDHKYDLFIPINYNTNPVIPHKGSVIFLHLTKNYRTTAGCIAINQNDFLILLKIINKKSIINII